MMWSLFALFLSVSLLAAEEHSTEITPVKSRPIEKTKEVIDHYEKEGRWFGKKYYYLGETDKFTQAESVYIAEKDGVFLSKNNKHIAYKKGDILFKVNEALGWFRAPATKKELDVSQSVPNPDNVKMTDTEKMVVLLTNKMRAQYGLKPLRVTQFLMDGARQHTNWMSTGGGLNHTSKGDRAENIALGQRSPEEVLSSWMNSSGHRANILHPGYETIGVGSASGYWTQQFQTPR